MIPVLTYAFLVVLSSTLMMIPVMLYALDLRSLGWRWQHAAVFTSMISSTDAVAVSAILHSGEASIIYSRCCELMSYTEFMYRQCRSDVEVLGLGSVFMLSICVSPVAHPRSKRS